MRRDEKQRDGIGKEGTEKDRTGMVGMECDWEGKGWDINGWGWDGERIVNKGRDGMVCDGKRRGWDGTGRNGTGWGRSEMEWDEMGWD